MDSVRHYRTERVRLETEPELAVNIDGEVVAGLRRTSPSPTTPSRCSSRPSQAPRAGIFSTRVAAGKYELSGERF